MTLTFGFRSKKLWYLNLSRSTSFSFTSCSIRDLDESNHLERDKKKNPQCHNIPHLENQNKKGTTEFICFTLGWFLLYPEVTEACRVWPGCLAKRWAGWRRGCWDCLWTGGCPQTRLWWVRVGCRLWSRRSGSWSCCTSLGWSRCSLKAKSKTARFRWWQWSFVKTLTKFYKCWKKYQCTNTNTTH